MGNFFSDAVELALEHIYYNERSPYGRESFQLLVKTAASGDGDACGVLSGCLRGPQYVWSGRGFPEDGRLASKMLQLSLERGSSLGILTALRCGELPFSQEDAPDLQAAFDSVLEKAAGGEAPCQYTIG